MEGDRRSESRKSKADQQEFVKKCNISPIDPKKVRGNTFFQHEAQKRRVERKAS